MNNGSNNKKGFTQRELFYPVGDVSYEYLDLNGEQIYFTCHEPYNHKAQATIIIAFPFGHERTNAYLALTRWARYLAMSGLRAITFDYRGCGESSGPFEAFTFEDWEEDLGSIVRTCRERYPRNVIILSGLRLGAILSSRVFSYPLGDGLLLWEGLDSGHTMFMEILRLKMSVEVLIGIRSKKIARQKNISELASEHKIYVLGQFWTPKLWKSGFKCKLIRPDEHEVRPWTEMRLNSKSITLNENGLPIRHIRIPGPSFWNSSPILNPKVDELFVQSRDWILSAIATMGIK